MFVVLLDMAAPHSVENFLQLIHLFIKMGEPKKKLKWQSFPLTFNRLVNPIEGSALKKEGFYATNESTLKSLKAKGRAKEIIQTLLKRAKLEKISRYLPLGYSKIEDDVPLAREDQDGLPLAFGRSEIV
jgi:hypothetical protein